MATNLCCVLYTSIFGTVYVRTVSVTNTVQRIHIAVVAALANLFTALPGIPDIMHIYHPLPVSYTHLFFIEGLFKIGLDLTMEELIPIVMKVGEINLKCICLLYTSFFSHYDPNMVEWFAKMVEERKQQHDSSKEKKNW